MSSHALTRRLFLAAQVGLLAATVGLAIYVGRPEEWRPRLLVGLLMGLALFGERFSVEVNGEQQSASTVVIILAVGLLGPAPAAACGVIAAIVASTSRELRPAQWLNNLATSAAVPFAAGVAIRALAGNLHVLHVSNATQSIVFGLIVFGVFVGLLIAFFLLVGFDTYIESGRPITRQIPDFLPLVPGEMAAGALAAMLVVAYKNAGLPALIAAMALLLIFQHLTVALVRSEERAEHLQARSRQLVGLQLGVLRTLVRALSMRDETTGRHAAAVAAYAAALATDLGCTEEERDAVRAAGLLHEIGKFTWPDRILHAATVEEEDMAIVRNHPQEGAILVGALDGYGPVADAILYHHERMDGRGYPAGLIGQEIPLASRILAICSTYNTITARESYRSPMTPEEAAEELRVAGRNGQLDPELVTSFLALLEREGTAFAKEADFETELEFERRVTDMAKPPSTVPQSQATKLRRSARTRRTRART